LLAPRDVTETARQGQGIGDLEAMRQMATTAIPEVLRNAPVTSTPMSAFDVARSLANRDMSGAGMAALGMIPFAGMIDDVGRGAAKAMPKIGNALDALKQFSADMAENTAILRRRWEAAGNPPLPPPKTPQQIRAEMDDWYKAAEVRNAKLSQELDAAQARVNQAKIAHQEATAYRRAIGNDPNAGDVEYMLAKKKEQELKDAWLETMEQRRLVWQNNPIPRTPDD
jgi:hypothetical protein